MKKVTIKDIADIAGVSISTVSRVLNGKGNVDLELKEKVLRVIKDTGFQPSSFARSFRKKSVQIDILLSEWKEQYLRVLHGLTESLCSEQLSMNLKTDLNSLGDFVVAIGEEFDTKINASMIIGQESPSCSVVFDYFSTTESIVRDLLDKGAENFAFLCENLSNYRAYRLYSAFMKTMFKCKIESYEVKVLDSKDSYGVLMESSILPDVILCSNDDIAASVMKVLKDEGIKVPDQVSVIGYGNFTYGSFLDPALSSVEYMNEEAGKICGQYILKMIKGEEVPKRIILATKLIKRKSSL